MRFWFSNYRQRLHQAIVQTDPLTHLLAELQTRDGELQQARHEADRTRLELHRVQEELKQLGLADGQKQQLLDKRCVELQSLQANLQALRQELQPKVDNLEEQLENRDRELQTARDDAELTLTQLHQVKEELQKLFLADRKKQQLLDTCTYELQNLQENNQAVQQELQAKAANLEQQLENRDRELQNARDDAELTLTQLHQVQEELQKLFLADRHNQQLLGTRTHELHCLQENNQALQQELKSKVADLAQQLQNSDRDLQNAREDAELSLTQLHQVQEELQKLFLADRHNQQLLGTRTHELHCLQENNQALQQELKSKVADLAQQLQNSDRDLQNAREDAELTLMQLHQVQEELERYFLQSRAGSQLLEAQTDQLNRAKRLMAKLAMNDSNPHGNVATVAVEVLKAGEPMSQQPSLQVQALINTYASSLERASELLNRAMRR